MTSAQLILSLSGVAAITVAMALGPDPQSLAIAGGAIVTIVTGRAIAKRNGGNK